MAAYGTPPPIPTGRWLRSGYSSARKVGAENDSSLDFLYRRYDANMSGTSLRIYQRGAQPVDDFSFMDTPIDLYFGWQPRVFPWLMVDGFAGYDLIDLAFTAFTGYDNYSSGYSLGTKASLGVDWFSLALPGQLEHLRRATGLRQPVLPPGWR